METIEYKRLASAFRKNVRDLLSDLMDIDEGKTTDNEQQEQIIKQATDKLAEYDNLLNTLEDHFVKAFKASPSSDDMEDIRKLLVKVSKD